MHNNIKVLSCRMSLYASTMRFFKLFHYEDKDNGFIHQRWNGFKKLIVRYDNLKYSRKLFLPSCKRPILLR